MKNKNQITKQSEAPIPTPYGTFYMSTYALDSDDPMPMIVLSNPRQVDQGTTNIRIHSECMTGDLFGSQRCDCGEQLAYALNYIAKYGGMVIYLRQEGRGIGIINKLKAYNLQDEGRNTLEANLDLGFHADDRDYSDAINVLQDLGISSVNLLTNNPEKVKAFDGTNIKVEKRIPVVIQPVDENLEYLKTKKEAFGHYL